MGRLVPAGGSPGRRSDTFAHPVERELARLFDAHGIRWLYEPCSFVLDRSSDGSAAEAFTPDFYLPDLDVYVECTAMRQAWATRKTSKARRACERYGVLVVVLYRRDFERLARVHGISALERAIARDSAVPPGGERSARG